MRLELQADCYAGVWGHSTQQRGIIDNADVEQGLNAAAAIGDDRLQRMAGRTVNPESFTHGSSKQRVGVPARTAERAGGGLRHVQVVTFRTCVRSHCVALIKSSNGD